MRGIIVFAFVCAALAQVHGAELDEEIQLALGKLNIMASSTFRFVQYSKKNSNKIRHQLDSDAQTFIREQGRSTKRAIFGLADVSIALIDQARESNLPQEVILCILKASDEAIKTISEMSSTFQGDLRKLQAMKLNIHGQEVDNIEKIEKTLPGRYEQAVAAIKGSTTVEGVRETLQKLETEYINVLPELDRIETRMKSNRVDFFSDAVLLTGNVNKAISSAREAGLENMRQCVPKTE